MYMGIIHYILLKINKPNKPKCKKTFDLYVVAKLINFCSKISDLKEN